MSRRLIDPARSAIVDSALTPQSPPVDAKPEPTVADINIDDLLGKNLLILYRETRNLLMASSNGKLTREDAMCVRDNIRLLKELKADEKDLLDDLTEDELVAELEKRTK